MAYSTCQREHEYDGHHYVGRIIYEDRRPVKIVRMHEIDMSKIGLVGSMFGSHCEIWWVCPVGGAVRLYPFPDSQAVVEIMQRHNEARLAGAKA